MKPKKKPGPDTITHECFKHAPKELQDHLLTLYKILWKLKHTPPDWQHAGTVLLYKGGMTTLIKNYRPLTMLATLLKIWENILLEDMTTIIEAQNLAPRLQTGTFKQTDAQLTILVRKILIYFAEIQGKDVFATQFDYNKAFNRVNRAKLWVKLHEMGITGLL